MFQDQECFEHAQEEPPWQRFVNLIQVLKWFEATQIKGSRHMSQITAVANKVYYEDKIPCASYSLFIIFQTGFQTFDSSKVFFLHSSQDP